MKERQICNSMECKWKKMRQICISSVFADFLDFAWVSFPFSLSSFLDLDTESEKGKILALA